MRRILTMALVLGLLSGAMSASASPVGPRKSATVRIIHHHVRPRVVAMRFEMDDGRPGYSRREIGRTLWVAAHRFNLRWPFSQVTCIVQRESGFYPKAQNPRSSALGLLQILDSTWAGWWARFHYLAVHYHLGYDRTYPRNIIIIGLRAMADSLSPWGGWCT